MFDDTDTFNQNLTVWCVSLMTCEPTGFSNFALTTVNKPIWGACP